MSDSHSLVRSLNEKTFNSFGENLAPAMQALELANQAGDRSLIAQSKCIIGSCLMIQGRTSDARPWLDDARVLFESLPGDPVVRQLQTTLETSLGMVCDDLSDYENARQHHARAVQLAQDCGDAAGTRRALIYLGYAHFKLGDGEAALNVMMDSLYVTHGAHHLSYVAYDFIADLLEQQGLWDFVLEQRLRGLEHLRPIDRTRTARVQCGIARCLLNLDRLDEASDALAKAEAALEGFDKPIRSTIKLFEARALFHLHLGEFESARHFQRKTLRAAEDCGSIQFADDARLLEASIELAAGNHARSDDICQDLESRVLSFHRRLTLDSLRENLLRQSGDFANAYALHLRRESSQRMDLAFALKRKEEIHRMELETLRTRALVEKNEQLEKSARERDDLMNLLVHDMANHLQVTRSSMDVIKRLMSDQAPKISVSKEVLMARSTNSLDLIEAMLAQLRLLWQVESNLLEAAPREVKSIAPLIEETIPEYRRWANTKKQELTMDVRSPDLNCEVNSQHLTQIIGNLLSNAIKYSAEGTSIRLTIDTSDDGARARIRIEDQGQGMTREDIESAFQRFRRLSAKPTAGEPSNGLGLYLVKRMAEPMRGQLSVWSGGKNQGTVFTLELPLAGLNGLRAA